MDGTRHRLDTGPDLLSRTEQDYADMTPAELLDELRAFERAFGALTVAQAAALRAFDTSVRATGGEHRGALLLDQEVSDELALATKVSPVTAARRLGDAQGLGLLPHTSAVLRQGTIGVAHAQVLVSLLTGDDPALDPVDRESLERRLVGFCLSSHVTPGRLRARTQRLLLSLDPDGARRRRERAQRRRSVRLRPDQHGMAWLSAYLPTAAALACHAALDRAAAGEPDPDDERGTDARRADALVDRLLTGQFDGNPPHDAPPAVTTSVVVNVTVPLTSLVGLDSTPAVITGHGAVDAAHARELAWHPDATWRRLVTDPMTGTVLDIGTTRYRPPDPLARYVRARDVTCRWPGCATPASRCDLDHTIPYPIGATSAANLVALCRRHHRLKTLTAFDTQQWTSVLSVRTPAGQQVATGPAGGTDP